MQRIVCESFEEPAVVALREEPTPAPGDGEVLVEVDAVGVSFVDDLIARGRYQVKPPLPYTPGSSLAGRVTAVGDGVTAPAVGDRVAALLTAFGGFTSHAVLPASAVVAVPDGVSPEIAATAIENYCTLVFGVTQRVAVQPASGSWCSAPGAGSGWPPSTSRAGSVAASSRWRRRRTSGTPRRPPGPRSRSTTPTSRTPSAR